MTHMSRRHRSDHKSYHAGNPIHRDSRVISKVQPRIRIIHIFAPEIIQTDVANFRELVQRLTGKASSSSPAAAATTTTTERVRDVSEKNIDTYNDDIRDNGGGLLEGLNQCFMQEMNPFEESFLPLSYY